MAPRHAIATPVPTQSSPAASVVHNYSRALAIVTTLFFMWGFLTCSNHILIPHLKTNLRPELRKSNADPVHILFGVLLIFSGVVEGREQNWLSENNGCRSATNGCRSFPVHSSRIHCFVPALLDREDKRQQRQKQIPAG